MHEAEQEIYQNIMRKDAMARRLRESLIAHIRDYEEQELGMTKQLNVGYNALQDMHIPNWLHS
jgi:hypothetical protein